MYNYTYDDFYRFETATFGVYDNETSSNAFVPREGFIVYGDSSNGGVAYDIIGNITQLNRNGNNTPGFAPNNMQYLRFIKINIQ